jgi:hypothetical protein
LWTIVIPLFGEERRRGGTEKIVLKKLARIFPDREPNLREFYDVQGVDQIERLVSLLAYVPFQFVCAWCDRIVKTVIRTSATSMTSDKEGAISLTFGAVATIFAKNFDWRYVNDAEWLPNMYRRLASRVDEEARLQPIFAAFIGRLYDTNTIMESALARLPRRIDPEDESDEDKLLHTLTWLYAIRSLPKKQTEWIEDQTFRGGWKPSRMLLMEVARLMDHNDPDISTAAHAAMFQIDRIDGAVKMRLGEIPPMIYEEGDEFKKTEESEKDKCECSRTWCARVIPLLHRIIYFVFLTLAPVLMAFSLYLMILVLFAFFSSVLMSYWFAPLFGVLSEDSLAAVSSILRLILSAPLMALFIVYFIRSVNGFLESGIELIKVLAGYVACYTQHTQKLKQENAQVAGRRHWHERRTVRFIGLLVADALLVLLLCFPDVAAFWGVLLLPIVIQLGVILWPVYCYW